MNTHQLIIATLESRAHAESRIAFTHPVVRAALEISRARLLQNHGRPVHEHRDMLHGATLVDAYHHSQAST
jgi:hypothetical protein